MFEQQRQHLRPAVIANGIKAANKPPFAGNSKSRQQSEKQNIARI
ncbi:hypothetical protein HMPREF9446_01361 [Bacteroides fluxus YIT 12057]|uniref:Uncharacterized protein n=1 Tax=Bacteroides fluxus YIT 12057 TaxID=763034 RepID=F3PRL0_9BACE|nr:hypothetical protein HMPREF9446_01361 [Bacteroides fluxus YIT 12057]